MQASSLLCVAATIAATTSCTSTPPSCKADDVDCFTDHLVGFDNAANRANAVLVSSDAVASVSAATGSSASAPALTRAPVAFSFPQGTLIDSSGDVLFTEQLDLTFDDPNGCQPVIGLTVTGGGKRSKHTGCFPGIRDMLRTGTIPGFFGFDASAAAEASLQLEIVAISSTDCASIDNPSALLQDPNVVADHPIMIPLTIAPQPGGGSGSTTCPGGLLVSTLECSPLGSGGASSYCLTASEYTGATGQPLPAACAPAGTTGCESESGPTAGVLVKPCCPGLTCRVGSSCGDSSGAVGGTCAP